MVPKEGWHVLHQIYAFDAAAWSALAPERREEKLRQAENARKRFLDAPSTQIRWFSTIGRADFGFLALSADLQALDVFEKAMAGIFSGGICRREYSFLSLTEESEYKTTDEEFAAGLEKEEGLKPGTPEMEQRLQGFRERMAKYRQERIYPQLGDWKAVCFYPMAKRRLPGQNWYGLAYEERRALMAGHARVGRTYAGRVKQIITGATGLGDWEWGVTLFSNSIDEFKAIIYEMRFDEVSHRYAEFGPFYIGILLPWDALAARLGL